VHGWLAATLAQVLDYIAGPAIVAGAAVWYALCSRSCVNR